MVTHQCSSTENYQLYVPESAQVGKPVGKIKANDEDLGVNADIKYSIINSEGSYMFSISTDRDTREGIISLKKVNTLSSAPKCARKWPRASALCCLDGSRETKCSALTSSGTACVMWMWIYQLLVYCLHQIAAHLHYATYSQ